MSLKKIVGLIFVLLLILVGYVYYKMTTMENRTREAQVYLEQIKETLEIAAQNCDLTIVKFGGVTKIDKACFGGKNGFKRAPKDPWGHEFVLEKDNSRLTIKSLGKDGAPGGEGSDKDLAVVIETSKSQ